ncbi:MAG: hypothetical protein K2G47_10720, partial [Muribaculum sp.]|nr:hypothetical protein [Muribaculum sp.]
MNRPTIYDTENGKVKRVLFDGGYATFDAAGVPGWHYFLCDHAGSVRVVADAWGRAEQISHYYPYGLTFADAGKASDHQPYKFGGKELDAMYGINLHDFHARIQIPDLGRFDRPDPLCEKTPHLSPYLFCANDPVNNTDPTGMDIWDVDQWGKIVNRVENTDMDQIRLVNQDGSLRQDKDGNDLTLEFDYGIIESQESISTGKDSNIEIYKVRGDANATTLFEFFSDNISTKPNMVEFSHVKTGVEGDRGLNFISTGHIRGSEPALSHLYADRLQYYYTIREMNHSHPIGNTFSPGDNLSIEQVRNTQSSNKLHVPIFKIYHVPTKKYIHDS